MHILQNKWLIANYVLFAIFGIILGRILSLSLGSWEFWLLVVLVIAINFTSAISMKKDIELSNKSKP